MTILYTSSFDQSLAFSDTTFRFALTNGVEQHVTLPGDKTHKYNLLFGETSNANVFVGYNVTATIPADNTTITDSFVEFMTPDSKRMAQGGDVISLITPDTRAYVGMSVRKIPN